MFSRGCDLPPHAPPRLSSLLFAQRRRRASRLSSTLQTALELWRAQERRTLHRLRVKYGVVGADLAQGVDLGKAPRCAGQHSVVAASHASWAYEPEMSGHMKAAGHV